MIASGYNLGDTHSEIMAINKVWMNRRKGTTVINLMIRRTGSMGNARPCGTCMEYLRSFGVDKVIYFNGSEFVQERI